MHGPFAEFLAKVHDIILMTHFWINFLEKHSIYWLCITRFILELKAISKLKQIKEL